MSFLKSIWKNNSKHKKLPEEQALKNAKEAANELEKLAEDKENENDDTATFKLKYLGSTVVESIKGENVTADAVKSILKVAKAGRKKYQTVNLSISLKGIEVKETKGAEILKVSIYRISNCSTDPNHKQIFSFISTNENESMECHAFLCSKRKVAETVTLAVALVFAKAYEAWRILPSTKEFLAQRECETANNENDSKKSDEVDDVKLIDLDDDYSSDDSFGGKDVTNETFTHKKTWVSFDDDFGGEQKTSLQFDLVFA